MAQNVCPQCGAPCAPSDSECKYCGEALAANAAQQANQRTSPQQQASDFQANAEAYRRQVAQQQFAQQQYINNSGIDPSWPIKNKIAAGLLAIFLGGLGIHEFYLGKIGFGILCLLFCWTGIPAFVGFIQGIIYLCSNDHNFQVKHHVRLQ